MLDPVPLFTRNAAFGAAFSPLIAFAVIMIFLSGRRRAAAAVSIGAVGLSFLCALALMIRHFGGQAPLRYTAAWAVSGDITVTFGFMLDSVSLLMLLVVATISLLTQIYSLGYMAGDAGYSRYYGFMSLFAWSMISLVISPALLQLYIFWELVGLASYLLIGFWFQKFSAGRAGKKAFLMTRTGDVFFLLGVLLLLSVGSVDILQLNEVRIPETMGAGTAALAALLIFGGIIGKSAQFPLMTWLPDAMEGPTPVSALLHSATMVAAGVYLFGRLFPFFHHVPAVMTAALAIGAISMLTSAATAMVSRDIKQVWAYSTISQLGYMLMGLGAGGYAAGIFHLTTHAGFKALLFLCAGILIHACETNDIFELGHAGARRLRFPTACMLIGGGALAGIWPFSGFASKEAVIAALAGHPNPVWAAAAVAGVFFTAYYAFRVIFVVAFPEKKSETDLPGHRPTATMLWPVGLLAAVTLVSGFFHKRMTGALDPQTAAHGHGAGGIWLPAACLALAFLGIYLAWREFGRKNAARIGFIETKPALYRLFSERWYLDRLYDRLTDRFIDRGLADLCKKSDDHAIDGFLHTLANGVAAWGRLVSGGHNVLIQTKLLVLFAAVFGLTLLLFFAG